ncbi:MAG: ribonuclease III [Verrucomicrobiota bacterium]
MLALAELQFRLGWIFRDDNLLRLALTHPSVAHEQDHPAPHNQRLEFLGDSVIGLVITRELYHKFPEANEGTLTKSRAKLVNAASLAAHGRALGIGEYLVMSRSEENTGGRQRASALADAFEALLGAVFIDGGYDAARDFILREFAADIEELALPAGIENPKGELQELLQSKSPNAPVYELVAAEGPDHDRSFVCAVLHEGAELARGVGKSKKNAESDAALVALKTLRMDKPDECGGRGPTPA